MTAGMAVAKVTMVRRSANKPAGFVNQLYVLMMARATRFLRAEDP
jgi:hypothetical protein